jgi:hypothetical protein
MGNGCAVPLSNQKQTCDGLFVGRVRWRGEGVTHAVVVKVGCLNADTFKF